jgi:hypothetical protein
MRNWARSIALAACLTGCAFTSFGAESATLAGKVEDAAGKPVEHATVIVYEAGVKHGYSVYCPSCWPDCGKRAVTGADGAFHAGQEDDSERLGARHGSQTIYGNHRPRS